MTDDRRDAARAAAPADQSGAAGEAVETRAARRAKAAGSAGAERIAASGRPGETGETRAARRASKAKRAAGDGANRSAGEGKPAGKAAGAAQSTKGAAHTSSAAGGTGKPAGKAAGAAQSTKGAAHASSAGGAGKKARGSKSAKRKRKRDILHSTFYRVYFAAVLVCLVAMAVGMHWLNGLLADYEVAQPVYVAEQAAKLFEDGDYASIYDYDTAAAQFDDREMYAQRMSELTQGAQISWTQGYSSNDDERVYDVRLDGERFAQLLLTPSGETTGHGDRFWALNSITTYVQLEEPEPEPTPEPPEEADTEVADAQICRITVPSDSTVTVDGVTLTAAEAVRTDIPAVADGLLPKGIETPTLIEYEFHSESEEPDIVVIDVNGEEQEVREAGERAWSCGLWEDAQLKKKFKKSVATMAEGIARCAARSIDKRDLLRFCVEDSPAYRSIGSFDDAVGLVKRRYKFENVVVSDFHPYNDQFFSCHVDFDYLNYYTNQNIKRDATSITLYCVYKGDSGKVYSFTMY